ncbi:MAG: hypothetical protein IJW87_06135, partial [Clostridia bacterium]|nr:hypothetical protein [Clostridia bacterium]
MVKEFTYGEKRVSLVAYADNIVRVHVGEEESLFDRYNLYTKPEENYGEDIEGGVKAGDLSVTYADGVITMTTPRVTRTVSLATPETDAVKEYFNTELGGMRPSPKHIICEDAKPSYGTVDIQKNTKYNTLKSVEYEIF